MKTRAKTQAYYRAVAWIALNDDTAETEFETIREQLTVVMVADVFEQHPDTVASDVIVFRRKSWEL